MSKRRGGPRPTMNQMSLLWGWTKLSNGQEGRDEKNLGCLFYRAIFQLPPTPSSVSKLKKCHMGPTRAAIQRNLSSKRASGWLVGLFSFCCWTRGGRQLKKIRRRQYWLVLGGTGSVWGGTGWYLVVLGQHNLVLLGIKWYCGTVYNEEMEIWLDVTIAGRPNKKER